MIFITAIDHLSGDIWHVTAGVTFSSYEDLELGDAENGLKVQEEVGKVLRNVFLARRSSFADREPSADRLLDPQDVGKIDPGVGVDVRRILAPGPLEESSLLQEAF